MKSKLHVLASLLLLIIVLHAHVNAQLVFPDSSFNAVGCGWYAYDGWGKARCMALQPDGKLVVAGYVNSSDSGAHLILLMRLNPDGTLDTSFDNDGFAKVSTGNSNTVNVSLAIQPDGAIVTTGVYYNAPSRRWFFDSTLQDKNPPGFPVAYAYTMGPWTLK